MLAAAIWPCVVYLLCSSINQGHSPPMSSPKCILPYSSVLTIRMNQFVSRRVPLSLCENWSVHLRLKASHRFLDATIHDALSGTSLYHAVEQLALHLDDNEGTMQSSVADIISILIDYSDESAMIVLRILATIRNSHRSTVFCDKLSQLATVRCCKLQNTSSGE
mmetsp:Transcript_25407/g.101246  ORF Transcript_25407/g.101246 Transcript_25407/m.101246 type:complete len:164 (-) Transcript_25407:589-1080(-)